MKVDDNNYREVTYIKGPDPIPVITMMSEGKNKGPIKKRGKGKQKRT